MFLKSLYIESEKDFTDGEESLVDRWVLTRLHIVALKNFNDEILIATYI